MACTCAIIARLRWRPESHRIGQRCTIVGQLLGRRLGRVHSFDTCRARPPRPSPAYGPVVIGGQAGRGKTSCWAWLRRRKPARKPADEVSSTRHRATGGSRPVKMEGEAREVEREAPVGGREIGRCGQSGGGWFDAGTRRGGSPPPRRRRTGQQQYRCPRRLRAAARGEQGKGDREQARPEEGAPPDPTIRRGSFSFAAQLRRYAIRTSCTAAGWECRRSGSGCAAGCGPAWRST